MGNADSKLHFRKAVIQLTTKTRVSVSRFNGTRCKKVETRSASGEKQLVEIKLVPDGRKNWSLGDGECREHVENTAVRSERRI